MVLPVGVLFGFDIHDLRRLVRRRSLESGDLFDVDQARRLATESYDRCFHPAGTMFQIAAIAASGSGSTSFVNRQCLTGDGNHI